MAPAPALAAPLPDPVAAMILQAARSDDPVTLAAIVGVARQTNPESGAEIDALLHGLRKTEEASVEAAQAAEPVVVAEAAPASPPQAPWKGSIELGGSMAQAAKDVAGAYGVVDLAQTRSTWSQRLTARGEYQQTDGQTSTQRFSFAYEPRIRFSPSRYAFGLAQYEHDLLLGYTSRYTLGAGVGLQVADRSNLKIAADFGPALRLTERRFAGEEHTVAARGSLNIRWLPTERLTILQEGAIYRDDAQASAKSITSLETLLFGPLKGRLSYNLQYEKNAAASRAGLDTTTRASLLYAF